jgi:hypothetical protein
MPLGSTTGPAAAVSFLLYQAAKHLATAAGTFAANAGPPLHTTCPAELSVHLPQLLQSRHERCCVPTVTAAAAVCLLLSVVAAMAAAIL